MNDLQKELQEAKSKVAELESHIAAVKWQPKGGEYCINLCDEDNMVICCGSHKYSLRSGLERQTSKQAERAVVEMRRFNRLLALRDELCGDNLEVDCRGSSRDKHYYVYYAEKSSDWNVSMDGYVDSIHPYFPSHELAQRACNMLNSGEVEL